MLRRTIGLMALKLRRYLTHRKLIGRGYYSGKTLIHGWPLHYYWHRASAHAPTILFIHGYLDTSQTFRYMFQYFRDCNIVSIDLPGFGRSRLPDLKPMWHVPALVRMVNEFLNNTGLNPHYIVGHSLGGNIALHLSHLKNNKATDHLKSLHLIAPGALPHPEEEKVRRLLFPESSHEVARMLNSLYNGRLPEIPPVILDGLLHYTRKKGFLYLAENTLQYGHHVFLNEDSLGDIQVPVYLYWGDEDSITDLDYARRLSSMLNLTETVFFEGAGHTLHHEFFEELSDKIRERM